VERFKSFVSITILASACNGFGSKKAKKAILYRGLSSGTGIGGNDVNRETAIKLVLGSIVMAGGDHNMRFLTS
jgi:hypothetical protein